MKSPQLVKNHLDGKNAQFSLLDPLKKSQLEHTKEIVRLFDTLMGTALYPFNGLHDFELSFDIGDKVEVYEENESGWWIGTLLRDGSYGRFPYNYFHFS